MLTVMSSPRVRRLESDYDRISTRFEGWPLIQVELADGQPPDMYRIWYNIKGLFAAADGRILEREEHVLEIRLGLEYPRRAPQLRLLTPLFHPNFNNTDVCAQDIYAASEGLDDLIVRIGRMIAYQEYNTKSPLNGIAARWAAENSHRLPVDGRELAPLAPGARMSPPPLPKQSIKQDDSWEDQIVIGEEEVVAPDDVSAEPVEFDCPGCKSRLRSPTDQVGMPVQCPCCRATITVPSPEDDDSDDAVTLRFVCPYCRQRLEAEADMAGDEIKCPSCRNTITVQSNYSKVPIGNNKENVSSPPKNINMPSNFDCPRCGTRFRIPTHQGQWTIQCPSCSATLNEGDIARWKNKLAL